MLRGHRGERFAVGHSFGQPHGGGWPCAREESMVLMVPRRVCDEKTGNLIFRATQASE